MGRHFTSHPFFMLVRKDVHEHLHRKRFRSGLIISVALFSLAAFVRIEDYKQSHEERSLFLQRWRPAVEEQLLRDENIQVENTRAVSPLAVLSVGLESVMPFRFSSTKEGLRFGSSRGAQNTVDALFGYLDVAFIVSVLLSLLTLAVTFDSICGEQSDGTLALLLSYPVSRATLLAAKIASNTLVVGLCFLPPFIGLLGLSLASGLTLMNLLHWVTFALFALLYLLVFVLIGVAVSAHGGSPADAALRCLFAWVIFVFIIPRAAGLAVHATFPSSSVVELSLAEDEATSRLRVEYTQRLKDAVA